MIARRAAAILLALAAAGGARADDSAEFYKNRQINWILSTGEGGGYTSYARVIVPYLQAQIPGNPKIAIQTMPGAGGVRATLHLYNIAPRDGSTIGMIHSSVPLAPIYGVKAATYDSRRFNWLGSFARVDAICVSWATSPVRTTQDLFEKEFLVGSTGGGSQFETYPNMLNRLFGTKIKVVSGYRGGNDIYLAMERGELHGRCGGGLNSIRATRPDWLSEKKVVVPVVFALRRSRDLPDVTTIMDLAKDERARQIIELVLSPQEMDRPVLAPPGVPAERVETLRKAFRAAMHDPSFIEDMRKQRLDMEYVSGDEVAKVIERAWSMPQDVLAAAREALAISE